jgi:hypothetical protein
MQSSLIGRILLHDPASRKQMGHFVSCSLQHNEATEERIVRVENIRCIDVEGVEILVRTRVRVLVLDSNGSHTPRGLPTFRLGSHVHPSS